MKNLLTADVPYTLGKRNLVSRRKTRVWIQYVDQGRKSSEPHV